MNHRIRHPVRINLGILCGILVLQVGGILEDTDANFEKILRTTTTTNAKKNTINIAPTREERLRHIECPVEKHRLLMNEHENYLAQVTYP